MNACRTSRFQTSDHDSGAENISGHPGSKLAYGKAYSISNEMFESPNEIKIMVETDVLW
jgi:hypothetical protein